MWAPRRALTQWTFAFFASLQFAAASAASITQLNTVSTGGQISPSVVALPDNQFALAYADRSGNDGFKGGIFGGIYNARLEPVRTCQLNTLTLSWETRPQLAAAANGTFMAIWRLDNGWVEGQRFDAQCNKLGDQFTVEPGFAGEAGLTVDAEGNFWVVGSHGRKGLLNKYSVDGEHLIDSQVFYEAENPSRPVIATFASGAALIAWDNGAVDSAATDILGRLINADGTPASEPFSLSDEGAGVQTRASLAELSGGGVVAVWQSQAPAAEGTTLRGVTFDSASIEAQSAEFAIDEGGSASHEIPFVAGTQDGGFTVGWTQVENGEAVALRRFQSDGLALEATRIVSDDGDTVIARSQSIQLTELTGGGIVTAWTNGNPSVNNQSANIFGRAFDTAPDPIPAPDPEEAFTSSITQLNTVSTGGQISPSVVALPDNQFALAYADRSGNDGFKGGIFGGIYNARLEPVRTCQLNTLTLSWETRPQLAAAANGTFMAIWRLDNGWVEGQRFDAQCNKLGDQFTVEPGFAGEAGLTVDAEGNFWVVGSHGRKGLLNKYSVDGEHLIDSQVFYEAENPSRPVIATFASGAALIAWDNGAVDSAATDILGRLINADGTPASEPFSLSDEGAGVQTRASLAELSGGGVVAVWQSQAPAAEGTTLRGVTFDSASIEAQSAEFAIDEGGSASHETPFVAGTQDGGFTVGWTQVENGEAVALRRFQSDGLALEATRIVSDDGDTVIARSQSIQLAELSGGGIVTAWTNGNPSVNNQRANIYGRSLGVDGEDLPAPLPDAVASNRVVKLNAVDSGDQINPSVTALPGGGFALAYADRSGNDGFKGGIFGGIYDAGLNISESCGINTFTGTWETSPALAAAPNGRFLATWRQDNGNIQGQLFQRDCSKIGDEFNIGRGNADVTADGEGNFWVALSSNGSGFISKYGNGGEPLFAQKLFLEAGDPVGLQLAAYPDGRVLLVWYDGNNRSGSDIFGLTLSTEGEASVAPFRINETLAGNQSRPVVAISPSGAAIIAWESFGQEGALANVYGRELAQDGTFGAEFKVNESTLGSHRAPTLLALSRGGYVIGWAEATAGQLYLQIYDAQGEKTGNNREVSAGGSIIASGNQNLELVELVDGSVIATWDGRNGGSNIFARRVIDPAKLPPGDFFNSATTQLNSVASGDQINPSLTALPGGRFAVAYADRAQNDGFKGGIFGDIYDSNFEPIASCGINTLVDSWETGPNLTSAKNGNFLAIWRRDNGQVKGQVFSALCEKIGAEFLIGRGGSESATDSDGNFWVVTGSGTGGFLSKYANDGTPIFEDVQFLASELPSSPAVTIDSDGRALVAWYDSQNRSGSDIQGQYFDEAGTLVGEAFVINRTTTGNQSRPALATLAAGGIVAVWESFAQDGDLFGIYGAILREDGTLSEEFRVNQEVQGSHRTPHVIARSDGGFLVGWMQSTAPQHVYLQAYAAAGLPEGNNQLVSVDGALNVGSSQNIELLELDDGSVLAAWDGKNGGSNIFARILRSEDPENLPDLDGDGIPDAQDDDIDGDGFPNDEDAFPRDPSEWADSDGDGIGDNKDSDNDGDGLIDQPVIVLNSVTTGDQINPALAALPNNRFAMIYADRAGNDGNKGGIFGGIFDENLEAVTDCGIINTVTNEWQATPHIAAAPNGNFMAIWTTGLIAEGQLFSPSCEKLGDQLNLGFGFNGIDVAADSTGSFWVTRSFQGKGYLDKFSNSGDQLVDGAIYYEAEAPIRNVITTLTDGRAVVSWYNGNNAGGSDIFALFLNANGTVEGAPMQLNLTAANNQSKPMVTALPSGGFVAVWESFGQDGDLFDIYGRVFDASGNGGEEFWISSGVIGNHLTPFVTPRSSGGFVVGWTNQTAPQHVIMREYDSTGSPLGSHQLVSIGPDQSQSANQNIELLELENGAVIAAWDGKQGSAEIFAKVVIEAQAPPPKPVLSPITLLNAVIVGDQINPALAALPNNRFAMIYADRAGNDGNKGGIFGGIFDENLEAVTDCGIINTVTNEWQATPHIAAAPNGNFMAIWTTGLIAEGQLFSPSCEKLGDQLNLGFGFNGIDVAADSTGSFWVTRSFQGKGYLDKFSNSGDQLVDGAIYYEAEAPIRNVITTLTDGRAVVSWYNGNNAGGSDIFALFLNANGTVEGAPMQLNLTAANNQSKPMVTALPSGGFVAVWESFGQDGDLFDIYGRVFDANGNGGEEFWISSGVIGNHLTPFVTPRSSGGFVVGWTNQTAPQHVIMREYGAGGVPSGPSQLVSLDEVRPLSRSQNIEAVELSDGRLVISWDAIEGQYTDIFARTLASEAATTGPDFDGDGIPDAIDEDDDNDGIADAEDLFPTDRNDFADRDGDGIGDNADLDDDGDGLADLFELAIGAFAFSPDSDGDGVLDGQDAFPTLATETADTDTDGIGDNADLDDDNDGLSDAQESELGTNPRLADSDGDSVLDAEEIELGLNPLAADCPSWRCTTNRIWLWNIARQRTDSDGDGLTLAEERARGLDPASADSDGDGLSDGQEILLKTNPLLADSDGDGLQDGEEIERGTSALAKDTDGDSVDDGEELKMGLNPLEEDCPSWLCDRGLPIWLLMRRPGAE